MHLSAIAVESPSFKAKLRFFRRIKSVDVDSFKDNVLASNLFKHILTCKMRVLAQLAIQPASQNSASKFASFQEAGWMATCVQNPGLVWRTGPFVMP